MHLQATEASLPTAMLPRGRSECITYEQHNGSLFLLVMGMIFWKHTALKQTHILQTQQQRPSKTLSWGSGANLEYYWKIVGRSLRLIASDDISSLQDVHDFVNEASNCNDF